MIRTLLLMSLGFGVEGCALLDAMGAFGNCDSVGDCRYGKLCTTEGCQDKEDFADARICSERAECQSSADYGVECPGADGACDCLNGSCVENTYVDCTESSDCEEGEYCSPENHCFKPFECGVHDDCSSGMCTVLGGCADNLPVTSCYDASDCSGICINFDCFHVTATSCPKGNECPTGQVCSVEDHKCYSY